MNSPAHLTNTYKKYFGVCPLKHRAAELLKEGKYNISEVADLTGFTSLSHFSTSFKKQFGISPSDYK
jgi:AraC-like DNA-binding protein